MTRLNGTLAPAAVAVSVFPATAVAQDEGADLAKQLGGGVRYWLDTPPRGPEGWGIRMQFTLNFPR